MKHTVIGVDSAKRVFQLYWVERETGEIMNIALKREKFLEHFANRAPCLIGMEAGGGSQHWTRQLKGLGHTVKLLPGKRVKPLSAVTRTMWLTRGRSGPPCNNRGSRRWRSRAKHNRPYWRCIACANNW